MFAFVRNFQIVFKSGCICISTSNEWVCCSMSSPAFGIVSIVDFCRSKYVWRCFNLPYSVEIWWYSCTYLPSVCFLWWGICSDLSLIFKLGFLFSCCSVPKLCLTLCDAMNFSTPGFPVFHCLLDFAKIHIHWIGDAI